MSDEAFPRSPDRDTIVCRCESLRWEKIQKAVDDGASSISDLKRRTRLGMGPCQGIYCLPYIEHRLADAFAQIEPMTLRPPARTITLSMLAKSSREP